MYIYITIRKYTSFDVYNIYDDIVKLTLLTYRKNLSFRIEICRILILIIYNI